MMWRISLARRVALLDEALAERLELLLVVREAGVFHERLGELLLGEAAGLDEARAELLVGDRQGDGLDAPVHEVDEAVLLEVADLEHAGGGALREELQDAGEVEPVDRSFEQHGHSLRRTPVTVAHIGNVPGYRERGGRPGRPMGQIDPASAAPLYSAF